MKKIIGIYLLIYAAVKGVCLTLSLRSDSSHLPFVVLAVCAAVIVGSVYVAVVSFLGKGRLRQLSKYFVIEILLTVFNITVLYLLPAEILPTDNWVTGNLFTLLVDLVIIYYLTRERRYIRTRYISGDMDADPNGAPQVVWPLEEPSADEEELEYEGPEIIGQDPQETK